MFYFLRIDAEKFRSGLLTINKNFLALEMKIFEFSILKLKFFNSKSSKAIFGEIWIILTNIIIQ